MTRLVFDVFDAADPNGTPLGELTDGFAKEVRVEFNALGSGRASVNLHDATQAAWLAPGNLVKVRLDDGDYFFAFWLGEGNDVAPSPDEEGGEVLTRGGRGALAYLERAILYPTSTAGGAGSGPQTDGNWLWEDDSYAGILQRLVDEAQSRSPSPLPDLTVTLNTSATIPGEFRLPIGLDYLQVIQRLQSLGLEVRMSPTLDLEASDDLSATPAVTFTAGVNIRDAGNRQIHATPVKSRMIVQGTTKGGVLKFAEVTDADLEDDPQIGRREGFVEYGAATDDEVLLRAGQQALRQLAFQHEGPITIGVTIGDGTETAQGHYVPFVDYRDGDLVTLTIPSVVDDVLRVQAITLRQTETDDTEVILELEGVPFDPVAVAIGGDTTSTGGGGGGGGANTRDCEECPPIKPPGDPFTDCDPFQKFNRATSTSLATEDECETFDSFTRTVSGDLGTGESGLPWTEIFNTGTNVDVDGSQAVFESTTPFSSHSIVYQISAGSGQFWNNDSWSVVVEFTPEQIGTIYGQQTFCDFAVQDGSDQIAFHAAAISAAADGSGFRGHVGLYTPDTGFDGEGNSDVQFAKTDWVAGTSYSVRLRKAGAFAYLTFWQTGGSEPGPQLAATVTGVFTADNVVLGAGCRELAGDYITVQDITGCTTSPGTASNEWGSDQLISDTTGLSAIGQANGFAWVEWQDTLSEDSKSFITNRVEVANPGYFLPTLGAGGHGDMVFTMPVKFTDAEPGASDDATAHISTRMLITLPGGNVRGVGMYVHDGAGFLEVYDGASWSEDGGLSESKEWNPNTLYILRLDLSQDTARASVTGGSEIDLTPLDAWDPGTPAGQGTLEWQTSIVGAALYGSRFLVGEQNIRSLSASGGLIPPFWCDVPNQTQVPRTVIGHGDGVTTVFQVATAYQPGSFDIDVDGQPRVAIELDPPHGLVALEAPPAEGETVYGDWAYASSSIPDESGFDQTGTKVFFPDAPSLTGPDQGADILAFCEAQEAAGTVAAFNPGDYRVDDRVTFGSLDNLRIYAPGVTWQRVDGTSGMDEIIRFVNCNDLLVQGLTVRGPATDADCRDMDYSREDEHAIGLYNVKRGTFRGVHARFAFGDGWYMARGDDLDASTLSEHITWEDCDAFWTGRNGWSHITGRDFKLYRCLTRTNKLHGYDVEPNRVDDVVADLLLEDFGASDFDAGATPAGHGQSVAIGGGFGDVAATNVTLRRTRMDEPYLYVIGPSSGDPHVGVTVTGTISDSPGTASVAHVSGWVASDNDGMSMPASGDVT